jgi:hypothetical protein
MGWIVGCCRCMRVLSKDGKPIGESVTHGGVMQLSEIIGHLTALQGNPDVATFPDKPTADKMANHLGWEAIDGNHRCPACAVIERKNREFNDDYVKRHGFYLEWPV